MRRAQAVDRELRAVEGGVHRGLEPGRLAGAARTGQQQAQRGQLLQRVVVQLARPPAALLLGGLHAALDRVDRHVLRRGHGGRGRRGEGLDQALVLGGELGPARGAVERAQHAQDLAAEGERHEQPGRRAEALADPEAQLGARVRHPQRTPRAQHLAGDAAGDRDLGADEAVGRLAGGGAHDELGPGRSSRIMTARIDERAAALDEQLQDAVEVRLAPERAGDRRRRLQRRDRPLELVAALAHVAVEPGVVDRDAGPLGQDDERLLVGLVERAALLLGQVEVAVGLPADEDGHPQEAVHLGMPEREAVGPRVAADVVEAQRPRVADEHAEDRRARAGRSPIAARVSSSMPAVRNRSSSTRRSSRTPSAA